MGVTSFPAGIEPSPVLFYPLEVEKTTTVFKYHFHYCLVQAYFYFLHFLRIKCADRQGQEKHAFSDPTPGENDQVEPALTKNDTVEPAAATEEDQPTEEEEEEPGKMSPEPVEK